MVIITETTLNYILQTKGREEVDALVKQGVVKQTENGVKYLKLNQ